MGNLLRQVRADFPVHLARFLGVPEGSPIPDTWGVKLDDDQGLVYGLELDDFVFHVACRGSGDSPSVALALERLRGLQVDSKARSKVIRLVAVPYMGETGQRLCDAAGIGWMDLSGNAHFAAPRLRIHVEGKPNLFKRPGRPKNPFAPKSARVTRHLLNHPEQAWLQQELAKATGLTPTYVSRTVRRLEENRLLERDTETNRVRPQDPNLLLDAWAERYRFDAHDILKGHVSQPSTDEVLGSLVDACEASGREYAATALAAAWLRDEFASYRITTVYLRRKPSPSFLEDLGFREGSRGSNLWLVHPNDEGVFQDSEKIQGVSCVSAVQTYLDLLHHAERAKEAAEQLRARHLTWKDS